MYEDIISSLEKAGIRKVDFSQESVNTLLGAYKAKVMLQHNEYAILGKGSLKYVQWVVNFGDVAGSFCLTVGNHSEIAQNCKLITGGEHKNGDVVNNSFGAMVDAYHILAGRGLQSGVSTLSKGPVSIGSNVMLSAGVTVLSGISIGDGAVIGADSVVTKDIPPFAVAVGNPARIIRYRFDEKTIEKLLKVRWWDFSFENFLTYYQDIQAIPYSDTLLEIAPALYDKSDNNFFIFRAVKGASWCYDISICGAEIQGNFVPKEKFPPLLQFFVSQLKARPGQQIYLIKDVFERCMQYDYT